MAGVLYAVIAIVVITGTVLARKLFGSRSVPVSETLRLFQGLALMVDGSYVIITHVPTGRFVQFYKESGNEEQTTLVLDFPDAGPNVQVFTATAESLKATFPHTRLRAEHTGSTTLNVVRLAIIGAPKQAASEAYSVLEQALSALGARNTDRITVDSYGAPDIKARARAAEADLQAVAQMKIPILSRLVRRTLHKIGRNR